MKGREGSGQGPEGREAAIPTRWPTVLATLLRSWPDDVMFRSVSSQTIT